MLTGLSAFPLTPMNENQIDEPAYKKLIHQLATNTVDSICTLGSTGNYMYLSRAERAKIVNLTVEQAEGIPVIVGIGALRVKEVLLLAEDAQQAGASAVLLAPVSYQELSESEVFDLYKTVNAELSIPLCVYDNPRTTHFSFTDELLGEIAQLSKVRSIKIPPVPLDLTAAKNRILKLRTTIPAHVSLGISGDASAAIALNAGCDTWYSVTAGLFPQTALAITRAAQAKNMALTLQLSQRLDDLWSFFAQYGSLRVIATAAELLDFTQSPSLPLPLKTLQGNEREKLKQLLNQLELN